MGKTQLQFLSYSHQASLRIPEALTFSKEKVTNHHASDVYLFISILFSKTFEDTIL